VTGLGVGLAVYLFGNALVPSASAPNLGVLIAALLIAVGIGAQI